MPQTKLLYPYAHSSQIRLLARDPHDPTDENRIFQWTPVEEESDEVVSTLDLAHEDRPWNRIKFQIEASIPDEDLLTLVPPGADTTTDLRMYVVASCSPTRLREAFGLEQHDGIWRGEVSVRRGHVRGNVELTPFLVRATDLPGGASDIDTAQLATEHALRVADGRRLNLVVDPPNRRLQGFVKTVWEDFSQSTDAIRRANDSLIYQLDLSGGEPMLILNSLHTGMRAALHSRKRSGGAAVMRHVLNAGIAQNVWTELYTAAVASLDYSEESGEVAIPTEQWKRRVLEALVDQVPSALPRDQRLKSLAQLREGQMETLVILLSLAAQRTIRMNRLIKDAERAAETFIEAQGA